MTNAAQPEFRQEFRIMSPIHFDDVWQRQIPAAAIFAAIDCKFSKKEKINMKIKTNVRADEMQMQQNQTMAHGLKVKSGVKAGKVGFQHERV